MVVRKLIEFTRGWLIGDFEPSVLRTKDFEVAILNHAKGEVWSKHTHFRVIEYNVLLDGKMRMHGQILNKGDVFVISPYEIADPEFLEDCRVLVVKVPSVPSDKVNISYDSQTANK